MHIEFLDPMGNRVKGLYVLRETDAEELIAMGGRRADIASSTK